MYHLVLRIYDGEYIRLSQEEPFDSDDLNRYEDYYAEYTVDKNRPYYDDRVRHKAVVVNVFKTEEIKGE